MTDKSTLKTCATCKHHSWRDACCTLTGETKHKDASACLEHDDDSADAAGELARRHERRMNTDSAQS